MKQKKLYKFYGIIIGIFIIFLCLREDNKIILSKEDFANIENYDIILSKGESAQSKLIGLLNFSTDDYSHVGMMIRENDKISVLHSTPDGKNNNGIRYDDFQTFIKISNVSNYIVLRNLKLSANSRQKLKLQFNKYKNFKAPFDFDFNNHENKNIYCTELVFLILRDSGILKVSDFDLNKPIYPWDFLNVKALVKVKLNHKKKF